ncbi:two-component response regulator (CheY-like receiver domain and a winged-helix DNA-binding domain) [Desulforapulum autotrophicum HRM2]|uniref:Two-component response regulator (CheY-like receiver domain and a winged-helix DNA-binding domain) n=1 Tax=Desulforapulum autotrophicum (strain ATCC 43914 / DSM 3382 / VKM B-1955 / HRM2) TaxID=177437 RepID=C0QAV4_DESAH|nr:response regulator [Desulforapulum autotrophicum]ACN16887.1 two-component response regulator (CheY-like receiver domain and a winged-helix DNA-binding domain) [Desulforapulum autotrophicum HRM2]
MEKKIKVMMVDDEPRFRETASKLLKKKGFETTIAGSGEEAIAILGTKPQDVVLLDVKMEGMDGHTTLAQIKKIAPKTQVIMLTGHGTSDSAASSRKLEAFDYLTKPCDIDILAMKINEAFAVGQPGVAQAEKKVKDIMTQIDDYSTVHLNTTIREAIEKLMGCMTNLASSNLIRESAQRSLFVFDDKKNFIGMLSVKDIIKGARPSYLSLPKSQMADSVRFSHVFTGGWDGLFTIQLKALAEKKISELVLESPPLIDENANLMEVAELLFKTKKTSLIVTSGKRVVGILREQNLFFEIVNIVTR